VTHSLKDESNNEENDTLSVARFFLAWLVFDKKYHCTDQYNCTDFVVP
jgi:hypothetical protein